MNVGIYAAVTAQTSAERELESISANLANLQTTGFKRQGTATESFDKVLRGRMNRQVQTRRTTDFTQGEFEPTGRHTDLALRGEGFFAVETPTGEAYTRNGRLMLDEAGVLQTFEGYPLAWEEGAAEIDPRGAELSVDAEGRVRQGEQTIGLLAIKNFANPAALSTDGIGYLRFEQGSTVEAPANAEVFQGVVERANVDRSSR